MKFNFKTFPKSIYIIGHSCSGKTTFKKFILENFPHLRSINDYPPLKEVAEIDKIIYQLKMNNDSKWFKLFIDKKSKLSFANEIWNEYYSILQKSGPRKISQYCLNNTDDSFEIIRPTLWDKILCYSMKNISGNILFEFSRGSDVNYLNYHDIDSTKVYQKSFSFLYDTFGKKVLENCIVFHLFSDFETRSRRNIKRKMNGGHFVSPLTMQKVYRNDNSINIYNNLQKGIYGTLAVYGIDIPVVLVHNDDKNDNDLEIHFRNIFENGINFFQT